MRSTADVKLCIGIPYHPEPAQLTRWERQSAETDEAPGWARDGGEGGAELRAEQASRADREAMAEEVASPGTMSLLEELDSLTSAGSSSAAAEGAASTSSLLDELDAMTKKAPSASTGGDLDSLMADLEDDATGGGSDLGSLLSALGSSSGPSEPRGEGAADAGDLGSLLAAFGEDLATAPAAAIISPQPETAAAPTVTESSSLAAQPSSGSQSTPEPEPEQRPEPSSEQETSSAQPGSPQPNRELQQAVRDLYREHVPDKAPEEVEANLARYAGREEALLRKIRKKYLQATPPASPPAPAPTAEEGDPPEPAINPASEWVKYVGTPVYDAAGVRMNRAYYRHRLSEELTLRAPSESVREIRQEKDTERFELDWRRAGGVMPQKEGWGTWIKRGLVETTAAFVEPTALTATASPAPQQSAESWGSWLKRGAAKAVGTAEEPPARGNSADNTMTLMTREELKARTPSVMNMMVSAVPDATLMTREELAARTLSVNNMMVSAVPDAADAPAGTDGSSAAKGSDGSLSGTV